MKPGPNSVLGPSDVHVWYCRTETLGGEAVSAAEASLSAEERLRASRFYFSDDRRDYVIAHDLVRRSLSRYCPRSPEAWRFGATPQGKPFISVAESSAFSLQSPDTPLESRLNFSLSHTRSLVACAVALDGAVGVDVEMIDRAVDVDEISEFHFDPRETAALKRCGPQDRIDRFFELWTLREAFVKAVGTGFMQPIGDTGFDLENSGLIRFLPPAGFEPAGWRFSVFEVLRRARLSVALHNPSWTGDVRFAVRELQCDAGRSGVVLNDVSPPPENLRALRTHLSFQDETASAARG